MSKKTETLIAEPEGHFAGAQGNDTPDDQFGFLTPVERKPITDPQLDPGDPRWNPQRYFGLQPKVIVVVKKNESDILSDPTGKREVFADVGINGYYIKIKKETPTKVPLDFAKQIVDCGAGMVYSDIAEA